MCCFSWYCIVRSLMVYCTGDKLKVPDFTGRDFEHCWLSLLGTAKQRYDQWIAIFDDYAHHDNDLQADTLHNGTFILLLFVLFILSRMRGWRHAHFYCSYIFTLFYHFYASYPPDICICAGLYTQDLICELGWLTYWIFFWIFDIEILNILLRDLGGQTNRVGEIL